MKAYPGQSIKVDENARITGFGVDADGMDLRDYFAIKIVVPLIDNFLSKELHLMDDSWMEGLSYDAYRMADEMIKERDRK
jgi:hypothetical protein